MSKRKDYIREEYKRRINERLFYVFGFKNNVQFCEGTDISNIKEIEKNADIEGGIIFYHEETRQDYKDEEQE